MAKPKHGRWKVHAGVISPGPYSLPPSPTPLPRHPRSPLRSPPRFPSPAVLSALALLATAPPAVAGGPLPTLPTPPPTFLCPFIERDHTSPSRSIALPSNAALSTLLPATTPSSNLVRQGVADRYVQGPDSLWRKADSWTLYGSTCCSTSSPSTSSTYSQPTSYPPTPTPTPTPTPMQFDTSVLPAGWNNTTIHSSTASSTILALAIILAGFICVFMVTCVFWRRRKKKARDLERKLARKLGANDDSRGDMPEQDARRRMRTWARTSARWKSNIRQSARRRRKKPLVSSIINRPPSPTISSPPQLSAVVPSAPSRRGSVVSQESDPCRPEAVPPFADDAIEQPIVPHDSPRPPSPPTYRASFVSRFSHLPHSSAISNSSSNPSPDGPRAIRPNDLPSFMDGQPPYIPPRDGHIATDDKAQLAHLRESASTPPTTIDAASTGTTQPVSAPEWHEVEDDLEDLGIDLSDVPLPLHNFDLPPSFPPPPSKADIPLGCLDFHCCRQENGIPDSLPVPGPPVPSLGPSPSAPPLDDPGLEPSAPPFLEGEGDSLQDWDAASSYTPDAPAVVDLDSNPTCATESSISHTTSSASRNSFSCVRESVTRDGILPRYHP